MVFGGSFTVEIGFFLGVKNRGFGGVFGGQNWGIFGGARPESRNLVILGCFGGHFAVEIGFFLEGQKKGLEGQKWPKSDKNTCFL